MSFDAVTPYLPAVGYLLAVSLMLALSGRVPAWCHLAAAIVGAPVRALSASWVETVLTLSAALVVFLVLVAVAARTVSGASLFTICVGLVLTPFAGWPGLLLGLLAAAVVAGVRVWRAMGKDRVWWLVHDTLSGLGISTAGGFKVPQPEHIPARADLLEFGEPVRGQRMLLPPYLLAGVGIAAAVAAFTA